MHLAVHNVKEAINTLRRAGLYRYYPILLHMLIYKYRDAIALLKYRLYHKSHGIHKETNDSELTARDLYLEWAQKSIEKNMFETAAQCYFICGEDARAIQCISRRADDNAFAICAKLAQKVGLHDKATDYAIQYVSLMLSKLKNITEGVEEKYDELMNTVCLFEQAKPLCLVISVEKNRRFLKPMESKFSEEFQKSYDYLANVYGKDSKALLFFSNIYMDCKKFKLNFEKANDYYKFLNESKPIDTYLKVSLKRPISHPFRHLKTQTFN